MTSTVTPHFNKYDDSFLDTAIYFEIILIKLILHYIDFYLPLNNSFAEMCDCIHLNKSIRYNCVIHSPGFYPQHFDSTS